MIDIPVSEIIAKIKEQKQLSEEEITGKIQEKLKQLAGLISEEGAAHIVANEYGVELVKTGGEARIGDLYPGMKNVTVPGKVTRKWELREFDTNGRKGKVANFLMGDETGHVRVTLWNEQTDLFGQLAEGDIVRVKNAFVKENRGYKELHLNTDSVLEVKPTGVTVGEVQQRQEQTRERKHIKELTGSEENVELLATIVQVYDPRFFDVCPECNKRLQEGPDGPTCPTHGKVTPQTNYVVSAFLDDGTGNIRTTFWKNQSQNLLAKNHSEMLQYQENPQAFEEVKTELLGEIIKVVGRCKKNETFDRIELTANLVFKDVDPEEELQRLNTESASNAEKLDAPAEVKEEIKAVVSEPEGKPHAGTVIVEEEKMEIEVEDTEKQEPAPEKFDAELTGGASEEAISLDDLEDLDEKL
jgi:hypothetical protein